MKVVRAGTLGYLTGTHCTTIKLLCSPPKKMGLQLGNCDKVVSSGDGRPAIACNCAHNCNSKRLTKTHPAQSLYYRSFISSLHFVMIGLLITTNVAAHKELLALGTYLGTCSGKRTHHFFPTTKGFHAAVARGSMCTICSSLPTAAPKYKCFVLFIVLLRYLGKVHVQQLEFGS